MVLLLAACSGQVQHVVEEGETLYSIGWQYGYDYRQLAQWNRIPPPYRIRPGQHLKVVPPTGEATFVQDYSLHQQNPPVPHDDSKAAVSTAKPQSPTTSRRQPQASVTEKSVPSSSAQTAAGKSAAGKKSATNPALSSAKPSLEVRAWRWPVQSPQLLSSFLSSDPARQGIAIAGQRGTSVFAAADGHVVYAGSGLPRYGKLIIVKHNDLYLSAYAHNHRLRVKEGEAVKAGQKIAEMGNSGTDRTKLYFEIRRNGKPVDPLRYLPR
jgi:lipoprotein NlpD